MRFADPCPAMLSLGTAACLAGVAGPSGALLRLNRLRELTEVALDVA